MHISYSRIGKIARLSAALREEINGRLHNGESGPKLLAWLNALPEVQSLLDSSFDGRPVTEQNLSEWRIGGYRAWQAGRADAEQAAQDAGQAATLAKTGINTDLLFTHLLALYAVAISRWDGLEGSPSHARLVALQPLSKEVLALRKSEQNATRLALGRDRLEFSKSVARKQSPESLSPASLLPSSMDVPSLVSSSPARIEAAFETPCADAIAATVAKQPQKASAPVVILKSRNQSTTGKAAPLAGPICATR